MRRIQPAPPDADTFRRAQERASLAPEWLPPETLPDFSDIEPPTHLPLGTFLPDPEEANVVAGEIEPPLYLDDAPTPPRPHFARSQSPVQLADDAEEHSVHVSAHAPRPARRPEPLPPPPRGRVARSTHGESVSRSAHEVASRSASRSAPASVYAPTPVRAKPAAADQLAAAVAAAAAATGADPAIVAAALAAAARVAAPVAAAAPAPAPVAVAAAVAVAAPVAAPAAAAAPEPRPSIPQLPGGIDPLLIPTPPELAQVIYGWVRRLALQADLAGADRMLRDALADLTSSLTVSIVYPGADELFSLGADEEVPKDPTPIIMVAQAKKAMIASHTAILPIVTSAEAVGVIMLTRNPRNPGYTPIEQVSMLCLAREAASIIHHLAVEHIQKASEVKADKGSLYRGEALEAHRSRGHEGVAIELSPGWVRRTYPLLVIGLVVALIFAIFIHVPTYSAGRGVIVLEGTRVPAATGGNVEKIFVAAGDRVDVGMPIVKLLATAEQTELETNTREYDVASYAFLDDANSESGKFKLAAALNQLEASKRRLDARTIRANRKGMISDIRVHQGTQLNPGDSVAQIIDPNTEPVVWSFLPGTDRPRIHTEQILQIELPGYNKVREKAVITGVNPEVVGGNEASRYIGAELADALKLEGSTYTLVKARLPSRQFIAQKQKLFYYHGMLVGTEVKVQSKPFLVTLLPALEKYLPD